MAILLYSEPAIFVPENAKSMPTRRFPATAGHTGTALILRGDIVILTAGALGRAATNPSANIAGLASYGELAVFKGTDTAPYEGQPFGFSQVGTLLPSDPALIGVDPFGLGPASGTMLELNLLNTTGWVTGGSTQANIGTTGGITLDAGTNKYVFDTSQSNKVMTIYSKPQGPEKGTNGDLGARVLVYFNSGLV